MRRGVPSASTSRSSGPVGKPSGGPAASTPGATWPGLPAGFGGGDRLRERRLVAEAARAIDPAEQHLQQVQRAAGLEAVGMGRDAAHRVHRHRAADHLSCRGRPSRSRAIGTRSLVEGDLRQFGGDPPDGRGGDAAAPRRAPGVAADRGSARPAAGTPAGAAAIGSGDLADQRRPRSDRRRRAAPCRDAGPSQRRPPSASRANRPSSAPPAGVRITSQGALV